MRIYCKKEIAELYIWLLHQSSYKNIGNAVPPLLSYIFADKVEQILQFYFWMEFSICTFIIFSSYLSVHVLQPIYYHTEYEPLSDAHLLFNNTVLIVCSTYGVKYSLYNANMFWQLRIGARRAPVALAQRHLCEELNNLETHSSAIQTGPNSAMGKRQAYESLVIQQRQLNDGNCDATLYGLLSSYSISTATRDNVAKLKSPPLVRVNDNGIIQLTNETKKFLSGNYVYTRLTNDCVVNMCPLQDQ